MKDIRLECDSSPAESPITVGRCALKQAAHFSGRPYSDQFCSRGCQWHCAPVAIGDVKLIESLVRDAAMQPHGKEVTHARPLKKQARAR